MDVAMWKEDLKEYEYELVGDEGIAAWVKDLEADHEIERVKRQFPMRMTVDLCISVLIMALVAFPLELWVRKRTVFEPEPGKI